ncbi:hypothetical protein [Frankia sp. AgW1.1]|uniref:hypothetical protein n=1 Tax=Frankia sp. AgW1.1 TaxID=1836971 RepID=UPI0019338AFE|nr:hypothetical protein [Frankia sp. AgW1.1]MBL7487090.1 hypothetical protein [Frankia sp. AgW1.1]
MATAYRFAGIVAPDGVTSVKSTTLTAKVAGTSTAVALYSDPTLSSSLSGSGLFTTDANGFAEWATSGVSAVDFYNGSTLIQSGVILARYDPVFAPLNSSGGLPGAYTSQATFALNGSPTGVYVENMSRVTAGTNLSALTTQVMLSTPIYLTKGTVVTNLTFVSGATAAGTPTNYWVALYSNAATPALLAQSADQTSTAWAAETALTLALSAPQTITTSGVYYAAIMVKATTPPTLAGVGRAGAGPSAAVIAGNAILAQTSGSSLTATAPATIATPTTVGTIPLVVVT